jgi:hypothetical protein
MDKLSRRIFAISAKAHLEAIKVYEKELPEELQNDETFTFFTQCLQKICTDDLFNWATDKIHY